MPRRDAAGRQRVPPRADFLRFPPPPPDADTMIISLQSLLLGGGAHLNCRLSTHMIPHVKGLGFRLNPKPHTLNSEIGFNVVLLGMQRWL